MKKARLLISYEHAGLLFVLLLAIVPPVFFALLASGVNIIFAILITVAVVIPLVMIGRRLNRFSYLNDPNTNPKDLLKYKLTFAIWLMLSLYTCFQMIVLSGFMADIEKTEWMVNPSMREFDDPKLAEPFFPKHNCFTSYMVAAHLLTTDVENIYDKKYYRDAEVNTPIHETIDERLEVDQYQYPPQFLILPRLLMATGGDFFSWRAYWHVFTLFVFTVTAFSLAHWLSGDCFNVYWFIWPVVLIAPVTQGSLQIENVHLLMITLSIASMLLFEHRRNVPGGLILGFVVVSKIFPGVLIVFLLVRKKWRAVVWTVTAMMGYTLIALLWFGWQPFESFINDQLPMLVNGEAFWFAFEYLKPMMENSSIVGISYKLEKLGVLSNPALISKILVWLFTGLIFFVLYLVRSRKDINNIADKSNEQIHAARLSLVKIWLVLIILAQMRSPFLPGVYGNFAVLWLLALLIPNINVQWWKVLRLVIFWFMLAMILPLPWGPTNLSLELVWTLIVTVVTLVICTIAVIRFVRSAQHLAHE